MRLGLGADPTTAYAEALIAARIAKGLGAFARAEAGYNWVLKEPHLFGGAGLEYRW